MIRIFLFLILAALIYYGIRRFIKTPPEALARAIKWSALILLSVVLLYLGATGRLNWLLAVAGLVFAGLARWLPWLLRYAPQLQRLWYWFRQSRAQSTRQSSGFKAAGAMSVEEAYEVLGLKKGAGKEDIIKAHRKLMQKMHPDRGGSDYFAAKLNLAKETLLKN